MRGSALSDQRFQSQSWCSECGGRLGREGGVSVGCGASSSLQGINNIRQEGGQHRPGPLLLPHPGAYIITTKMLRSRESRHPGPALPQAQPWCLEDALCGFMSLASPTGSCLPHGIPWPGTPQSHEENVMYFPMSPATPVPRTVTAGEPDPHQSHTCAKNRHDRKAKPSP